MSEERPYQEGETHRQRRGFRQTAVLFGAMAAGITASVVLSSQAETLSRDGRLVASIGLVMAVLWLTEALPLAVTSLLPLVLLPLFSGGSMPVAQVASRRAARLIVSTAPRAFDTGHEVFVLAATS